MLVPWPRQAQRFVPRRQLHRTGTRILGKRHAQHCKQNAIDIVLRLRFGQAQRIHLHAITEAAQLGIADAITPPRDLIPQPAHRTQLADFSNKLHTGIDEETHPADGLGEFLFGDRAAFLRGVENRNRSGKRKRRLLHRIGTGLLQMVGAEIDRIPFRQFGGGEGDGVGRQAQRRPGREDIGAAGEIFLDDVVLRRALQAGPCSPLFIRHRNIKRQQPGGRRVDRHRGVHLRQRQAVEQGAHVAQMADRHADLAHLTLGEEMIAVVTRLRRQIEGHGKPRLPLGQICAVKRVGGRGTRMPRIGAENPWFVAPGFRFAHSRLPLAHLGSSPSGCIKAAIALRCNIMLAGPCQTALPRRRILRACAHNR